MTGEMRKVRRDKHNKAIQSPWILESKNKILKTTMYESTLLRRIK